MAHDNLKEQGRSNALVEWSLKRVVFVQCDVKGDGEKCALLIRFLLFSGSGGLPGLDLRELRPLEILPRPLKMAHS